jgi:hypothetical protein
MPNSEFRDSIYYFKRGEFKNYFQGIYDKSMWVSDALATFREVRHLPNKFKQIMVQQVVDDPSLIGEIYEGLKKMKPQSKYKLPFKKEDRQVELIENIAENYNIDKDHTQAKIVTGRHKDEDTDREFNYLLEAVIAPRKKIFKMRVKLKLLVISTRLLLLMVENSIFRVEIIDGSTKRETICIVQVSAVC